MAAGKHNLIIQQGSTFSKTLTLKDPTTNLPLNLTGATVRGMARENYDDTSPVITFSMTVPAPATGVINMTLTAAQTALYNIAKAYYDVEIQWVSGVVDRILQGNIILSKEATK
jgi:hypothetical protein